MQQQQQQQQDIGDSTSNSNVIRTIDTYPTVNGTPIRYNIYCNLFYVRLVECCFSDNVSNFLQRQILNFLNKLHLYHDFKNHMKVKKDRR